MAKTPEKKVKDQVVALLKKHNTYYFYPVTGGFGTSGVPDIVACHRGTFIGIECKAGGNKPTALQEKNLKQIAESGGIALVINETNVGAVAEILAHLDTTGDTNE
jgi:Holliday junction resolvase